MAVRLSLQLRIISLILTTLKLIINSLKANVGLTYTRHVGDKLPISNSIRLWHQTSLDTGGIGVLQGLFLLYLEMVSLKLVVPIKRNKLLRLLLHRLKTLIIFVFVSEIQLVLAYAEILITLFDRHGVQIMAQIVLLSLFIAGSANFALFVSRRHATIKIVMFDDVLLVYV